MLRAIFSKTTLVLLAMLFVVLWLSGGILNQLIHPAQTIPSAQSANPGDASGIVVKVANDAYQVLQPVANEFRAAFDRWWSERKMEAAQSINQWLIEQKNVLLNSLQVKLQEWINRTLGITAEA